MVDGATLERLCGGNSTGGSNPPPSANVSGAFRQNPAAAPFSLLVKPAGGACNLDCRYCFYKKSHPEGYMSFETAELMLGKYMSLPFGGKSVSLQGGEPLLALHTGVFDIVAACGAEKSVQTNATLVTDGVAERFARENWLVGVSIDGPEPLNRLRGESFKAAAAGIARLERAGADCNILCVVSKANVSHPREIYRFLRDAFSSRCHQYIECTGPCEGIDAEEWGRFLSGLFDEWIENDARTLSVRLFDSIVSRMVCGRPTICSFSGSCRHHLVVEHDGSVYPCDFYVSPRWKLGNIRDNSFEEILASPLYAEFASRKTADLPRECAECEYLEFCMGDCPRNRRSLCAGWRMFFAHALPRLEELARCTDWSFTRSVQS